jgi:hypothetical protein
MSLNCCQFIVLGHRDRLQVVGSILFDEYDRLSGLSLSTHRPPLSPECARKRGETYPAPSTQYSALSIQHSALSAHHSLVMNSSKFISTWLRPVHVAISAGWTLGTGFNANCFSDSASFSFNFFCSS